MTWFSRFGAAALAFQASAFVAQAAVSQYTITRLPTPQDFSSSAYGVSNSGAVGTTDDGGLYPAYWTASGRVDLPILDGFTRGSANAVSNSGVVVGSVGTLRLPPQGVKWANGVGNLLPTEDNDADDTEFLFGSIASAINTSGVIVGQSTNQYGDTGVVWTPDGNIKLLMGLAPEGEYQYSWAQGVNDAGVVAGYAKDANGVNHAMIWNGDTITQPGLFYPEGESVAHAINENGDVVGWGTTDDGFGNAFVFSNGTLTKLDRLPGCDYGEAFGITDDGLIVGQSLESGITGRGFATIWKDGQVYDLESLIPNFDPNWQLLGAFGVSDDGKIVGFGTYDGQISAFMLTPGAAVPEPATMSLGALGGLALLARRRRA